MEHIEQLLIDLGVPNQQYDKFEEIKDIKPTVWTLNEENVDKWNQLYSACKNSDLNRTILTPKNYVSTAQKNILINSYSWYNIEDGTGNRLCVIINNTVYNVSIRMNNAIKMSGWQAFTKLCSIAKKEFGIDLKDYKCSKEEGLKWKEQMPAPRITMYKKYWGQTLDNIHHIDFHSSFPAGIIKHIPSLAVVFKYLYENRKEHPEYKEIMNRSIGYFQSKYVSYSYSELSYWALIDNEERISKLSKALIESGRRIIGYNTDGIWYQGEIYHGEGEGSYIGDWENDYSPDMFRAWSNGVYEFATFELNGTCKVTPILRGRSKMDEVEPDRSKWNWGDVYKYRAIAWEWNDEQGFVEAEV